MEKNKQRLLREIQRCNFALTEARLYLDSHPTDQEALLYFQKMENRLAEARAAYEEKYGTIATDADGKLRWTWVDSPWPWEMEG